MELSSVDNSVLYDIKIMSQEYSEFRTNLPKWRFSKEKLAKPPLKKVDFLKKDSEVFVFIYKQALKTKQCFSLSVLRKRAAVKRNPKVFKAVWEFWKLVNPYLFPAISEQVYTCVLQCVYSEVFLKCSQQNLKASVNSDTLLDFKNHFLRFIEFYDAIFECLDKLTKSKLANEYSKAMKNIYKKVSEYNLATKAKVYSRKHLSTKVKPKYFPWMIHLIKNEQKGPDKYLLSRRPSIMSKELKSPPVSQRLFQKSIHKRQSSAEDLVLFRIRRLTEITSREPSRNTVRHARSRTAGSTSNSRRSSPKSKDSHLDKSSPLSTQLLFNRRKSSGIEDVIAQRNSRVGVFRIPS